MDRTVGHLLFWFFGLIILILFILSGLWYLYIGIFDTVVVSMTVWSVIDIIGGVMFLSLASLTVYMFLDSEGYL